MIEEFLARAKRGESVYIDDVAAAFQNGDCSLICTVTLPLGGERRCELRLPTADSPEKAAFVRDYFYAWIYNMISILGGRCLTIHLPAGNSFAKDLCAGLDAAFQVSLPKKERTGYGKCLNVTDRVNAAMGAAPFHFVLSEAEPQPLSAAEEPRVNAVSRFRETVRRAGCGRICGMDVGGTDIKVVGVRDGKIAAFREFDWNPAAFAGVEQLMTPMMQLTRAMRAALSVEETAPAEVRELVQTMLAPETPLDRMEEIAAELEKTYAPQPLSGIGISFPDVVIDHMIVGGETLKTKGIREQTPDYETEFPKLRALRQRLMAYCCEDAQIHMANDGSLAAYTAAVEWAWREETCGEVPAGVFAHTLGTELGTGWIDEAGGIPQIPLEAYNCILDLGAAPARTYAPTDVRSVLNFNTGLSGTLQKYTSQYGAYRMALRNFRQDAPEEYEKLFSLGYLERRGDGIFVIQSPKDMRKALLEYLMNLAAAGQPQAEAVFREIGTCLAVTWWITEQILHPAVKSRVLFGRFVKKERCFALMQEGAAQRRPISLRAANGSLAFTPLMLDLEHDETYTVAQFGQAVGAVYFAVS